MGSRNHSPLSENAVLVGGNSDRLTRRERNFGEAGEEQTEANHFGAGRKIGEGIESCQIRGMFSIDPGKKSLRLLVHVEN